MSTKKQARAGGAADAAEECASLTLTQLAASNTNRSELCEVGVPSELAGRAVRALCSELREAAAEGDVIDVDRYL